MISMIPNDSQQPTVIKYYADVVINVPEELDLSHLRGRGLQPGEEELPEGEAPSDQASQAPGIHSTSTSL